ncbi:hypothetical protein D3C80_1155840 [compost metagenome]
MANQVGQLERPHAEAASVTHQRIQAGAIGGTFLHQAQAFGIERPRYPVDDETRCRACMYRLLAPGLGSGVDACGHCRVGCQARHHLDKRHQRCWVEKVHTDHVLWAFKASGEAGDGQ